MLFRVTRVILWHMKELVSRYIEENISLSKSDKILVGLSGGADSVALLLIMNTLGYYCEAAHCNFNLRGNESDSDEKFVVNLCQKMKVKLHRVSFDTMGYANINKISVEMSARELRYDWFEKVRSSNDLDYIAVAHHKDDSVETVLLNLIRGTGIAGLVGIKPVNGKVIRPLLCITRDEILTYLENENQEYVTDSTNNEDEYARNKIRLNIIPMLLQVNSGAKENIYRSSENLMSVSKIYKKYIQESIDRVMVGNNISINSIKKETEAETVLFEILKDKGFNNKQIKSIYSALDSHSGKTFYSSEWLVLKDRDYLMVSPLTKTESFNKPKFKIEEVSVDVGFKISKSNNVAYFDKDKIVGNEIVRLCEKGDWFIPFGMKGKKLVSDFLTDIKIPIIEKSKQYLLCFGDDIAWVVGKRTDNRFKIDEKTRQVIIYTLIE